MAPAKLSRPSSSPLSSSGRVPTICLGRAEEVLAVAGVPGRAGGGDPHPLDAVLVHRRPVLAQHGERALDGLGVELPGGVDALARAG